MSHASSDSHTQAGYYAESARVIPIGFDTEAFSPDNEQRLRQRQALNIPQDACVVAMLARYHPVKNHEGFLQAAARVLQRTTQPVVFLCAGTNVDPSNRALMNSVERLNLTSHVRLLGERSDVADLLRASDVLCVPSLHGEAFPNVIGEAMACGVPAMAYDIGDCARIIGETGWIVERGNESKWTEALHNAITMPSAERAAMRQQARARIVQDYPIDRMRRDFEGFYG